jgi:signal transduction histidine kinase
MKLLQDLRTGAIPYFQREKQYVCEPGHPIWILMSGGLIRNKRGSPSRLIIQIQDITEYKKGQEEKQRLGYDLDQRVKELTALHYAARLLQDDEKPTSILLQEIVSILPAAWEHAEIATARIFFDGVEYKTASFAAAGGTQTANFVTAGGKHGSVEITYPENRPNETRFAFLPEEKSLLDSITEMLQVHLERKEAKQRLNDVTRELVERNKELWSLQQEMGRVEQRAALGWMTGAIAHELGTPLNSVLGYTHLLAQEELPEKARRHVKTITSQIQRMTDIVQYYLDRTRGSTSQRSSVNVNELVRDTLVLLAPVFTEKTVRVITELEESLPSVNAHSGSLQRVLINLINNAVASIRQDGKITITTRTAQFSERNRSGINIEVTDTGAGIPADLLPRVFDLFITTKNHAKGSGLGLAVCQEIVKEHGGKITISSQVEKGTTVKIFLPTVSPQAVST